MKIPIMLPLCSGISESLLFGSAIFMCMDDKHRIKVGEPNYPVAATDRGRRVLVSSGETFEVADHNFTKLG